MYDFDKMRREQLVKIAKAALALSTKMVDTEQMVNETRSSFVVDAEWSNLTNAIADEPPKAKGGLEWPATPFQTEPV